MTPRRLAALHAGYFLLTGLWALVARRSFERVTGPKRDYWLVRLVGALAAAIGATLGIATRRRACPTEARALATTSAAVFTAADLYATRRYSRVYLGDIVVHALLLPQWWKSWVVGPDVEVSRAE